MIEVINFFKGEFFLVLEAKERRVTTCDGDYWYLADQECPAFIRKRLK